jgi:O-antigen ligase
MPHPLALPIIAIVFVAGLLFPPMAAYRAAYSVAGGAIMAALLLSPRNWEVYWALPMRLLWLAFLAFVITLPFVFQHEGDFYLFLALSPVMVAPAIVMLTREEPRFASPMIVGLISLAASFAALCVALNDIYLLGAPRAGGGNNPIHFAGLSIILGYMALIGLFGSISKWRYIMLLGPTLATAAVAYSSSRGPMLADLALGILSLPFLVFWFWRERPFQILYPVSLVLTVFVALSVGPSGDLRARNVLGDIGTVMAETEQADGATQQRLVLYRAALEAFKQSPVFGHGSGQLASATGPHMPDEYAGMRHSEHLHNDAADFAVIGGALGLFAYLCLLVAPLLIFWRAPDPQMRRLTLLGGLMLSGGYFTLGMTNAMFGILPQTMLYGVLLGLLVALAEQRPAAQMEEL